MKKLMAIAALALAMPTVAAAQEAPRGPGRGQMMSTVEFLVKAKEEFNATPEQVTKLQEIAAKFEKDTEKLREETKKLRDEMQSGGDRSALMLKMRPIREEMQKKEEAAVEEVLKILNAEQQAYVKQVVEKRKEDMANRRGQRPGNRQIQ